MLVFGKIKMSRHTGMRGGPVGGGWVYLASEWQKEPDQNAVYILAFNTRIGQMVTV